MTNTTLQVKVDQLAIGGLSIGEVISDDSPLKGIKAFVSGGVPGDIALVKIKKQKKSFIEGIATDILAPSPQRRISPCRFSKECGGCDLIGIEESAQTELKHQLLTSSLKAGSVGGHRWSSDELRKIKPIVTGPFLSYRNRVTLHVDDVGQMGFYQRGSRQIVPINECVVVVAELNQLIKELKPICYEIRGIGFKVHLYKGRSNVQVTFNFSHPLSKDLRYKITKSLSALDQPWRVQEQKEVTAAGGSKRTFEQSSAGLFFQVNDDINTKIIEYLRQIATETSIKSLWDLYSGAGNFGLALLDQIEELTMVEADRELTKLADQELKTSAYQKEAAVINSSVEKFLKSKKQKKLPHLIIADPPRAGLSKLVHLLPKAKNLILINCHLPSFFRDSSLLKADGWELKEVLPFDMFPQTSYLETVSWWHCSAHNPF